MNMVPGMVTSFWFTPTKTGRFDILCAQLCGLGHYNMRGHVVVEEQAAFDTWLAKQQTFAMTLAKVAAPLCRPKAPLWRARRLCRRSRGAGPRTGAKQRMRGMP
jgi:cytochrome c oxidase subunit 2